MNEDELLFEVNDGHHMSYLTFNQVPSNIAFQSNVEMVADKIVFHGDVLCKGNVTINGNIDIFSIRIEKGQVFVNDKQTQNPFIIGEALLKYATQYFDNQETINCIDEL